MSKSVTFYFVVKKFLFIEHFEYKFRLTFGEILLASTLLYKSYLWFKKLWKIMAIVYLEKLLDEYCYFWVQYGWYLW